MNKKIIVLFLLMLQLPAFAGSYLDKQLKEVKKNQKYGTVQKQTAVYNVNNITANSDVQIKDPKLIKLSDVPIVDEKLYLAKLKSDEEIYRTKSKPAINAKLVSYATDAPASVDFYNLYRITEKIIRANNLQYANWRIAVRKTTEDINAYAGSANLVTIHTSLYDSLYSNNDALALVIGHEMGHLLLGHTQRLAEYEYALNKSEKISKVCRDGSLCGLTSDLVSLTKRKQMYADMRRMEFMADNYGAMLAYRAGFDLDNAMTLYNLFNTLEHIKTWNDDHPQPEKRIENNLEARSVFPEEWINEGKYNIMNSNVLDVKKSSDRVSIVISADKFSGKIPVSEDGVKLLTRFAYTNYRKGKMDEAIKYFKKLADVSDDYIPYLYMSYANEYLFSVRHDKKYLNDAKKNIEKAKSLNPSNEYVKKQITDLNAL